MDILKYLDVLIGLAVVMVLLSPAVTAVTQFVMWARNKRPTFLVGGITDLISQLDARPAAWLDFTNPPTGAVLADVSVAGVTGAVPSGPRLFLESGIDPANAPGGTLTLTCMRAGAPLANADVTLTFLPRRARDVQQVRSPKSDAKGEATVEYLSDVAGYGSPRANVVVLDAAGAQVAATVDCAVDGNNVALTTSATGSVLFVHPGGTGTANGAPGRYTVKCTIKTGGQPAADHVVVFDFLRNTEADIRVPPGRSTPAGVVQLRVPAHLVAPAMTAAQAKEIADAVLNHPMISKGPVHRAFAWLPKWWERVLPVLFDRKGDVVEREELIRLLLELADGETAANPQPGPRQLQPDTRTLLRRTLLANGIPSPGRTLSAIRTTAQALERDAPSEAMHVRQAKAIITAAQSDFVGKINNWFDQTMARVTQRYAGYAKFVTVLSAFVVAFALQFDSLELLRRLSVDSTLRSALIEEGKAQQARVEAQAKDAETKAKTAAETKEKEATAAKAAADAKAKAAADAAKASLISDEDLAAAKAKRDEIDATLAKLRGPNLSIIPDHFVWQRVPQARLERNPLWTSPYPARFELAAGGSTYVVTPRWRTDVLTDLKPAIEASGAPVAVDQSSDGDDLLMVAPNPLNLQVCVDDGEPCKKPASVISRPENGFEEVRFAAASVPDVAASATIDRQADPPLLVVDDDTKAVPFSATPDNLLGTLRTAIQAARLKLSAEIAGDELVIRATEPSVRRIALLWRPQDPFSDVLKKQRRVPRAWLIKHADLEAHARHTLIVQIEGAPGNPIKPDIWTTENRERPDLSPTLHVDKLVEQVNSQQSVAKASVHQAGALVLTAQRLGAIQLRYQAGHPETNILNATTDASWQVMAQLLQPGLVGVIVSWALLSLGAPFWYDMLKNLLKLRPAPAIAEEKQRQDRAKEDKKEDTTKKT